LSQSRISVSENYSNNSYQNKNTVFQHRYNQKKPAYGGFNEMLAYTPAFCMIDVNMKMNQAQFASRIGNKQVDTELFAD